MFRSRKSAASKFKNSRQAIEYEEDQDTPSEQPAANYPAAPLFLQNPVIDENADMAVRAPAIGADRDALVQRNTGRRYAEEPYAPSEERLSGLENPEDTRLCIGRAIKMTGDVAACGILQVDGHFAATAQSKELNIAESGTFIGDATTDSAEIRGKFEGNLTVRNRLVIRSTGSIAGTIKYSSIEIEAGGKISGEIEELRSNEWTPLLSGGRRQP